MSKILTLKENRDFKRLYRSKTSFVSPTLVTYLIRNNSGTVRYGITIGKKIGNAVKRSRARRVIRAAFREIYPEISQGCDVVFVARGKTPYVKSTAVKTDMYRHFSQAGLIK